MAHYLEIATPSVEHRGVGISADSIGEHILAAQKKEVSLYRSYFAFDESLVEHLEKFNTIRGYAGIHYLDRILFDIDKGENNDDYTLARAKYLIDELQRNWTDNVQLWFSGTGYHIITPDFFGFTPGPFLPADVKATIGLHFPGITETHTLFYTASLIRAEGTRNAKSGLYKVQLPLKDLSALTVGDIHALAQRPPAVTVELFAPVRNLHSNKIVGARKETYSRARTIPTDNVTCSIHIYNEEQAPGQKRLLKAMRLVSVWRRKGLSADQCITLLDEWCPKYSGSWTPDERNRVVSEVFGVPYEFGCHDFVLAKYCDSICRYYPKKNMRAELMNIQKMVDVEREYAEHIKSGGSHILFDIANVFPKLKDGQREKDGCPIESEQLVILTGDTGLGKSSLTANILLPQKDLQILWVDRENSKRLMYRRLVQIEHNKTREQVEKHYKVSGNTYSHGLGHIVIPDFAITIEQILEYIANERPNLVVIDTLERQATEKEFKGESVELQRANYCIGLIKDSIRRYKTCWWVIHHLKKGTTLSWRGELQRLTTDSIKGTSVTAQQADTILAVERVTLSNDDQRRIFTSLKTRDSEPFETILELDGKTMRFA